MLGPVSLSLYSGETVGIVGANGAGKTTLLNIIARIYSPSEGSIHYQKKEETLIGYVPQDIALYEQMTGRQNLSFWADVYKLSSAQKKKRIDWILNQLHLLDKANTLVANYSGGMKRRLNLGVSMLVTPDILLLDEPTVGADDESVEIIMSLIQQFKVAGSSIAFISHHRHEVDNLCDRVIRLDHGLIVQDS